jgi:hypothetical protein
MLLTFSQDPPFSGLRLYIRESQHGSELFVLREPLCLDAVISDWILTPTLQLAHSDSWLDIGTCPSCSSGIGSQMWESRHNFRKCKLTKNCLFQ